MIYEITSLSLRLL